jgi:uncharacterized protein DUF4340
MNRRSLLYLGIALVVLAVLVVMGQRRGAPASGAGTAIVPGLESALNDLERVTLVRAGGATVATLERRDGSWVVAEKSGYPADVAKLRQSLRALAEAKILETKTANPELYDRLGVVDVTSAEATGISVAPSAPGKDLPAVILGDVEGTKYRYARRASETQSYLLDRDPSFPTAISQWLAGTIVDVRGDRVRQVTIKHPDGETVTVTKTDAGAANFDVAGIPRGRELLYPGVANAIGNALRELNLEDVEPAASAADERPVEVEFRTFDGLVVQVKGVERDDMAWVTFAASADPEQAARAATPDAAAPAADEPAAQAAPQAAASDASARDPAAEAAEINRRVGAWRYKIAGFQYDQMTRRMADLLKPPA